MRTISDPGPLKRTRMRLRNGSAYNSLLGIVSGTRNRPIAPGESGPCCQDSPTLLAIGLTSSDRKCKFIGTHARVVHVNHDVIHTLYLRFARPYRTACRSL